MPFYGVRYDFETDLRLQDIFSAQITPLIEKFKRDCPSLTDKNFINAGIHRIISENKTGRDFLQKSDEIFDVPIARTTFSDAMHSSRRLELLNQISYLNYKSINQELSADGIDYLHEFKDIAEYDVFSVDGHFIEHSSHTQRNAKGKLYASGNLYILNMRSGLIQQFACVSDGSVKNQEMPIFKGRMAVESSSCDDKNKTIWIR